MLLMDGIGDTIRISLAADPVEEVKVGFEILKSLKLRTNGINFIACPSCSRQNFDVVATMNTLEQRLEDVRTADGRGGDRLYRQRARERRGRRMSA